MALPKYTLNFFTGSKHATVGSACEDIQGALSTVSATTGTIHLIGINHIGDGKYHEAYVLYD